MDCNTHILALHRVNIVSGSQLTIGEKCTVKFAEIERWEEKRDQERERERERERKRQTDREPARERKREWEGGGGWKQRDYKMNI